jgi:type IV pilus assembly protein PilM
MSVSNRGRVKQLLAIDWDNRTLRVVHALLGKRGVKIDRLLSVGIPAEVDPCNPEQMGQHIRRVLDQEGIRTRHAIVDVPRDQAILKTLKLPVADREALPGIVEIQVAKELPFPVDQAVIDFAVEQPVEVGTVEAAVADVLVAVVRQEVLAQYQATFAAAGLRLDRMGLRPYANKVAVCKQLQFAIPERVLFIDVGASLTEIDVLRNSMLIFSRAASVNIPRDMPEDTRISLVRDPAASELSDVQAAAQAEVEPPRTGGRSVIVNAVMLEVTRSIEAYRAGDPGAVIDQAVIGGDVGIEEPLAEALQKRLGINAELYNPATSFGWEPDEGAAACAFAATLGLVLGQADDDALHLDFLHPKKRESATRKQLRKAPAIAAVLILFLTAGAVGFVKYTEEDRGRLAKMEARIKDLERKESSYEKFLEMMADIRAFDENQLVWVDVLYDVFSHLPPHQEFVVEQVDLQQDKNLVVLKTRAMERDVPVELTRTLEAFRRDGRPERRFRVSTGAQKEKKGEIYPFSQDLRIEVLDDSGSDGKREDGRR